MSEKLTTVKWCKKINKLLFLIWLSRHLTPNTDHSILLSVFLTLIINYFRLKCDFFFKNLKIEELNSFLITNSCLWSIKESLDHSIFGNDFAFFTLEIELWK